MVFTREKVRLCGIDLVIRRRLTNPYLAGFASSSVTGHDENDILLLPVLSVNVALSITCNIVDVEWPFQSHLEVDTVWVSVDGFGEQSPVQIQRTQSTNSIRRNDALDIRHVKTFIGNAKVLSQLLRKFGFATPVGHEEE